MKRALAALALSLVAVASLAADDLDRITTKPVLARMTREPFVAVQSSGWPTAQRISFYRAVTDVIQSENGTNATFEPACSDLTAICALTTTSYGRGFLPLSDAAAARSYIGAGVGSGDVVGPGSSTNSDVAFFSGTTGKIIKDMSVTLTGTNTGDETGARIRALGFFDITNDGTGSGLDADTVDGSHASAFQPVDSDLTSIAALATTSYGRSFLTLADAAAARTYTGLVIGTDVEAHDTDLTTIAALVPSNDDIIQRKAGAWTNRTMAQLATDLGLAGSYQPLDADLTSWAAITRGTGFDTAAAINVGSAGAFVTFNGALGTPSSLTLTNATGLPLTSGVTGTLPVANGGTNITSYTIGDLLYASGTGTLSKLAAVASGQVMNSNGVGVAATWTASPTLSTGLTVRDAGDSQYFLRGRSGLAFPVPYLRPGTTDRVMAFDLFPNGSPTENASGFAWQDICNADLIASGVAPTVAARTAARSDAVEFGMRTFNGAAALPIVIGQDGVQTLKVVTGTVDVLGALRVSGLTSGRIPFASTAGLLTDDADLTFATDTLTATKIVGSTSITDSGLTAGRVTFAGTAGLLSDDADFTFATDTLTATKIVGSTSITDSGLTSGRVTYAGTGGLLSDDSGLTWNLSTLGITPAANSLGLNIVANGTSGLGTRIERNGTTSAFVIERLRNADTTTTPIYAGTSYEFYDTGPTSRSAAYFGAGLTARTGTTVTADFLWYLANASASLTGYMRMSPGVLRPETAGLMDLGSSSVGWNSLYLDEGGAGTETNQIISPTVSGNKVQTLPTVTSTLVGVYAPVDLTAQVAAVGDTTLFTPDHTGFYQISGYLQITTAAAGVGASSILGGATGVVIKFNDGDGNVAQNDTMATFNTAGAVALTSATNTTATNLEGDMMIYARTGVAVTYAIGYTSVGTTAMQYAAHLRVEAL